MRNGDGNEGEPTVVRAVSVAVFRKGQSRLLAVRRPRDDEHFPGLWGLPAASLRAGETFEEAVARTGRQKLGVELQPERLLLEGETEREDHLLRMRLYEAEVVEGVPSVGQAPGGDVTQYTQWEWAEPGRLREAAGEGSLCCRLCLSWLGEAW